MSTGSSVFPVTAHARVLLDDNVSGAAILDLFGGEDRCGDHHVCWLCSVFLCMLFLCSTLRLHSRGCVTWTAVGARPLLKKGPWRHV